MLPIYNTVAIVKEKNKTTNNDCGVRPGPPISHLSMILVNDGSSSAGKVGGLGAEGGGMSVGAGGSDLGI